LSRDINSIPDLMHASPFPSFLELENAREDGASFAKLKNVCPQRVIRVEADVFIPSFYY
jgi:hypothetical protein